MDELLGTRCSVLVNSYNYRRYVGEAVASALAQTQPPREVIVVDDGSTDGTADWLRAEFSARDPRIRVISQANAGQLAAIETAVAAATGDLLFFLDADDTWEPDYLAAVRARFLACPDVDYVFSGHVRSDGKPSEVLGERRDRRLGRRSALAYAIAKYPISMTSTLAMRATLARRFLPLPPGLAPEWRTDADQVLALGAALAGGVGDFLAAPRVRYRIHGQNHYAGRTRARDQARRELRGARTGRVLDALVRRLGLGPDTVNRIGVEFPTIERPTWREFRRALRTAARAPVARERLRLLAAVCGCYLSRRFAG